MSTPEPERPVIIKRTKKVAGGHHGGAWKVAYADFVTAMMAFFMVMWLIASVNNEQRAAIFEYFNNPSMEQGKSSKPAPGQNGPGGASTSVINLHGAMDSPKSSRAPSIALGAPRDSATTVGSGAPSAEDAKKIAAEADHKKLESLMVELHEAIDHSQALKPFKDQLLLDITPEGLRIQIVDAQNRPMFDLGSARLKDYTSALLHELAQYLNTVPNHISLAGHTDTTPFVSVAGYTNWDLSADRANAARRALESGGLAPDKVSRVVGLSSSVLFDKDNPRNPINRRISIIVMTKAADESAARVDEMPPSAQSTPDVTGAVAEPAAAAAAESAAAPTAVPAATPSAAPAATPGSAPVAAPAATPAATPSAAPAKP